MNTTKKKYENKIKILLIKQREALKDYNYKQLTEINKQLYFLREQQYNETIKEKERKRDELTTRKIEKLCLKEREHTF